MMFGSFILVFILSSLLTWKVYKLVLETNLIDIPNERSSHSAPTPRGGGVAFVISFFLGGIALFFINQISHFVALSLLGSCILTSILGVVDDKGHIRASFRLFFHFIAAVWGVYWLNGLPPIPFVKGVMDLSFIGTILFVIFSVWLLNLYNFMDGIDGIASIQAITVAVSGAFLYYSLGHSSEALLPLILASSVAGFLVWNFPPAKIFMGDAGSGFLGITIGLFTLQAAHVEPQLFWSWIILSGVFIVDATYTLIIRVLSGKKFYEAHRSHAYQRASRQYGSHKLVTLSVGAINIIYLLPLSYMVAIGWLTGVVGVMLAYVPLIWLVRFYKAGEDE